MCEYPLNVLMCVHSKINGYSESAHITLLLARIFSFEPNSIGFFYNCNVIFIINIESTNDVTKKINVMVIHQRFRLE